MQVHVIFVQFTAFHSFLLSNFGEMMLEKQLTGHCVDRSICAWFWEQSLFQPDSFKVDFARFPMKMDTTERVLSQAHWQARPIADFLQENDMLLSKIMLYYLLLLILYHQLWVFLSNNALFRTVFIFLDFVHEEAMDDAWVATSYLSDAGTLLASPTGVKYKNYGVENIIEPTAASVAVRGVMFGSHHPYT